MNVFVIQLNLFRNAMLWSECSCVENPYIKILTPKVMVLVGGTFRWYISHEGRKLLNGICDL